MIIQDEERKRIAKARTHGVSDRVTCEIGFGRNSLQDAPYLAVKLHVDILSPDGFQHAGEVQLFDELRTLVFLESPPVQYLKSGLIRADLLYAALDGADIDQMANVFDLLDIAGNHSWSPQARIRFTPRDDEGCSPRLVDVELQIWDWTGQTTIGYDVIAPHLYRGRSREVMQ